MRIKDYIGSDRQLGFIQRCRLAEGKADGVDAAIIENGGGLSMMVLPGRGMDIPYLYAKGKGLHFLSSTGITASPYHEKEGYEWLRSFFAGTLTTCGLTFMGHPDEDEGEKLGLHGRISNTPAEDVRVYQEFKEDVLHLALEGILRESKMFGEHLVMQRRIETDSTRIGFTLTDTVVNRGNSVTPLMIMYHINFGYPLLNPAGGIISSGNPPVPGNEEAERPGEPELWDKFQEAEYGYSERLYYHSFNTNENKVVMELLENRKDPVHSPRVTLEFSSAQLPHMVEWKSMQDQQYVLGLEPCNVLPLGRSSLRERGELPLLEPGEERSISFTYTYREP